MNKHSFAAVGNDINIQRSTFDIPHRHLTTGNFGDLVPFYCMEVMPGDTFDVNTNMFARMATPLFPVMDDAFVEYNYFFVPMRLVYDRWAEFLGENKYTAWVQETDYIIPHFKVIPSPGDVYDHFGIPTYDPDYDVQDGMLLYGMENRPKADINFLPIRAYWTIWNEWYRNENTTDPVLVNVGDDVDNAECERYRTLARASKPFDAFTSALPAPQKGDAVTFGFADVPVYTSRVLHQYVGQSQGGTSDIPLAFHSAQGNGNSVSYYNSLVGELPPNVDQFAYNVKVRGIESRDGSDLTSGEITTVFAPSNLWAKVSNETISVNDLRQAFAMQRLLELQSRTGSRVVEIIAASFGVQSSDARLMRSQYLGGATVRLQMQQVTQNSSVPDEESPLGRLGAYSKTASSNRDFVTSFTEHGYVIGVVVARHTLTYQQGLAPMWSRRGRFDFYWPNFANIGEQPIKNRELYLTGDEEQDDKPFGYQEAWYDYRYKPNLCTGAFRSTVKKNLDEWHYADVYYSAPVLSSGWMNASKIAVDRTLAVTSGSHDQLLFDISVHNKASRPMPLYSTPGLVDRF